MNDSALESPYRSSLADSFTRQNLLDVSRAECCRLNSADHHHHRHRRRDLRVAWLRSL
jgi:hypothetical protein